MSVWLIVLAIIMSMGGGFILVLIIYTKLIKREVNTQISSEVNRMVENYVAMTETKSQNQFNKSGEAI